MPRKQLKPPIKLRRKFAPLIELCRSKILTAVPQTSGVGDAEKAITVVCRWPTRPGKVRMLADLPEDFPTGVVVERAVDAITIRHSVVALLHYFKAKNYCTFNSVDLFAMRLPMMMRLAKLELKLDKMIEGIGVEIQQPEETLDD